jgi:integrase
VLDDVKTEAGRREWALTHRALAAIEVQLERNGLARQIAGDRWTDRGLVFCNSRGGPLRQPDVNAAWHELLNSIGLETKAGPRIRMHDLRHSKGTVMANEGEDLVVIQRTLGHARSSITADIYVGKVPKALRSAADRWDALLDAGPDAVTDAADEAVS